MASRSVIKLNSCGIEGNLFRLLENYRGNRKQRVILDDQFSFWKTIFSGVTQCFSKVFDKVNSVFLKRLTKLSCKEISIEIYP